MGKMPILCNALVLLENEKKFNKENCKWSIKKCGVKKKNHLFIKK